MLRTIHLYGKLKKQFGATHRFDVSTAAEALRALNCAFPGAFVDALQTGSYKLIRGAKATGQNISAEMEFITELRLGLADLHLIPVPKGAANGKGVVKTVLGVALIGAAIFASGGMLATPLASGVPLISGITWGNIATVGLGVALMGASTLLTKPAATPIDNAADASKTFSGAGNSGRQGSAIQLIYGECLVGSVVVSFDSDIENIGTYQNDNAWGSLANANGLALPFGAKA